VLLTSIHMVMSNVPHIGYMIIALFDVIHFIMGLEWTLEE